MKKMTTNFDVSEIMPRKSQRHSKSQFVRRNGGVFATTIFHEYFSIGMILHGVTVIYFIDKNDLS